MALFGKNKSAGAKRPIIEVIKYDGPNDILIWKFPNEDFNTNTQLIVGPAQEAIFVKGGQVLERFVPGTYTLSTKNYPFIRSLVGLVTGGVSPYSCSVYYVNKAISMGIDWGTDTPISVVDPIYHVPIDIRSYGDFSLQVENGRMLLEKFVGQTGGASHQEIQRYFTNMMATQVRGVISGTMLERQLSPIGIDAHLADMSLTAQEKLRPIFEPFGMTINHFTIAAITAPELDTIKQKARDIQQHRMETDITAEDKVKMAQAQAFENRELNVSEQQKWVAQMGQTLAGNRGPVINGNGGLFGGGAGQPYTTGTADIASMLINSTPVQQPVQQEPAKESFEERAKKIKFLFDSGMISQEQYQAKIEQLMNDI